MKKIGLVFAALVLLGGMWTVSNAAVRNMPMRGHQRDINRRQRRQQRRIANGIRHGRLTARESGRLERREARINRVERRDRRSGGGLSHRERRNLNRRLNRTSRAIYRQKHDRQGRHIRRRLRARLR